MEFPTLFIIHTQRSIKDLQHSITDYPENRIRILRIDCEAGGIWDGKRLANRNHSMRNECKRCGGAGVVPGPKWRWYTFWNTEPCESCGGDGYARPPASPVKLPAPPPPAKIETVRLTATITIHPSQLWSDGKP